MVGWHPWLNGHEFEQTPGDNKGQGSLVCCSPWSPKDLNMTEWLTHFCCCLVTTVCQTLCNSMDCSMPGFPIPHHLPEFAQVHVHWIGDAIQLSHPLSHSSPSAFNLSQHQGLFQWVGSFHQVAKVLELQLWHQSFQWIFRIDLLQDWLVWSPCSPRNSHESFPAPQFRSINSSMLSLLYGPTLTSVHDYWKDHSFDYTDLCWQNDVSAF